jgi:hypothetical protein
MKSHGETHKTRWGCQNGDPTGSHSWILSNHHVVRFMCNIEGIMGGKGTPKDPLNSTSICSCGEKSNQRRELLIILPRTVQHPLLVTSDQVAEPLEGTSE